VTARERVLAALNHEEVDVPPVYAYVESNTLYDHFAPGEDDLLKAAAIVHRELRVDVTYLVRRPPRNAAQTVWTEKPYKTMADLEAWKPSEPNADALVAQMISGYEAEKAALEPDTVVIRQGGGFLLYYATGLELFSYALADRPALVEAMIENLYEHQRAWIAGLVAHRPGPAFQICEDLACKHGLLFNPAFLRRVFFPRLRELCEIIHAAGLKVILHTDGNVSEVLDDIVNAGVDGLNPLESMDLGAVKRRYGRNLVLTGNVASDVLSFGTPADVRRAVRDNIRAGWGSGGHWLDTSAGEFMPDVPLENALAYFAEAKEG